MQGRGASVFHYPDRPHQFSLLFFLERASFKSELCSCLPALTFFHPFPSNSSKGSGPLFHALQAQGDPRLRKKGVRTLLPWDQGPHASASLLFSLSSHY